MVITATCCINKYPHRYVNGCDTHSIATRTFLSSIYLFLSLHSSFFFLTVLSSSFLSSRTFVIYTSSVRPLEKENVLSERARETGSIRWYQTFCAARCSLRCKLEPLSVSSTSGVNAIRNSSGATRDIPLRGVVRLHVTPLARRPQNYTGALELHVKRTFCGGPECPLARPDESFLSLSLSLLYTATDTELFNLITRAQA